MEVVISKAPACSVAVIALQDKLGKSFDKIMSEWLIIPLVMKQAEFTMPLPDDRHPYTASGYQMDGTIIPKGWIN